MGVVAGYPVFWARLAVRVKTGSGQGINLLLTIEAKDQAVKMIRLHLRLPELPSRQSISMDPYGLSPR